MKVHYDGGWHFRLEIGGGCFVFVPAGDYEEIGSWEALEEMPEGTLVLNQSQARKLIPVLEEEGFLKPRLDERLRIEDLKITHRLLDIIEGLNLSSFMVDKGSLGL